MSSKKNQPAEITFSITMKVPTKGLSRRLLRVVLPTFATAAICVGTGWFASVPAVPEPTSPSLVETGPVVEGQKTVVICTP